MSKDLMHIYIAVLKYGCECIIYNRDENKVGIAVGYSGLNGGLNKDHLEYASFLCVLKGINDDA